MTKKEMFCNSTLSFFVVLIWLSVLLLFIIRIDQKLTSTAEANEAACTKARLACWYYDICHDDPDNPKHEVWTDKGRAKLHEWAKAAAKGIPADMLPVDVRGWVKK